MQSSEVDVYREILLKHARYPMRTGELSDADGTGKCHNPLCGDRISVTIIVDENTIRNIRIRPSGCSISVAGASLMAEMVEGLTIAETEAIIKLVIESLIPTPQKEGDDWPEKLSILSPLKRLRENTMKLPCVLISWVAVSDAILDFKTKESLCLV